MKSKRLIIETTNASKSVLSEILDSEGMTLTDWFNDKVEEAATPYILKSRESIINSYDYQEVEEVFNAIRIKEELRKIDWSFTEEDTGYLSHNIHPYPAKYIPQIPFHLIKILSLPGEIIWDPFGGSGTTALEAVLMQRRAISSDINPLAQIIGKAKTTPLTIVEHEELKNFIERMFLLSNKVENLNHAIGKHEEEFRKYIPTIPNMGKWFDPCSVQELAYIKWTIEERLTSNCKYVALATFSKIITRISYQDGETRYVSKLRKVKPGEAIRIFGIELTNSLNRVLQLPTILQFNQPEFLTANAINGAIVNDSSIDLIVTSPPYPNATDYHLYHRFRIFWMGFDPKEMAGNEIGSHLRHQRTKSEIDEYIFEMRQCLKRMFAALKAGRYLVLILGDAIFKNQVYPTAELLGNVAIELGFELVDIVHRPVHDTKRSFASPARRLREEKMLILRKPEALVSICLKPPKYKLWEYEKVLRGKEILNLLGENLTMSGDDLLTVSGISSSKIAKLRRLTFTHSFSFENNISELTWQSVIENNGFQENKSSRKDPKYATHGIHPYKGKFYPQLAKSLLNVANLQVGQRIMDPFCGSGTVLLECYLNGFNSIGFDLNPLAIRIAEAKTSILRLDPFLIENMINEFISDLNGLKATSINYFDEEVLPELESWFPAKVLAKLAAILQLINEIPEKAIVEFLEICLSSVVREVSHQEPKDLRIRRRKIPLEDAPVIQFLQARVKDQLQRILTFWRQRKYAPSLFGEAQMHLADSREIGSFEKLGISRNSIDAIITSPPYATALPYIDTDRLSILLLLGKKNKERSVIEKKLIGAREIANSEKNAIEQLIADRQFQAISSVTAIDTITRIYKLNSNTNSVGFRRKNMASLLYRYYSDMTRVFENVNSVVNKSADIFFVIGDNKTIAGNKEIAIPSAEIFVELGKNLGWTIEDTIPISVTQENRFHNKNGILKNDIVWFRKP